MAKGAPMVGAAPNSPGSMPTVQSSIGHLPPGRILLMALLEVPQLQMALLEVSLLEAALLEMPRLEVALLGMALLGAPLQ